MAGGLGFLAHNLQHSPLKLAGLQCLIKSNTGRQQFILSHLNVKLCLDSVLETLIPVLEQIIWSSQTHKPCSLMDPPQKTKQKTKQKNTTDLAL